MSSLGHNERFRSAALPNQMADFILSRYTRGMYYGDHVDEPIMGMGGPKFRTDLAMTLFLSDPNSYVGGELLIQTAYGENRVKLAAGSAILYPAGSLHRVDEVTSGERLVALTWMQSFVRDAARREILFELDQVRSHLMITESQQAITKLADRSYVNLLRMWSDV